MDIAGLAISFRRSALRRPASQSMRDFVLAQVGQVSLTSQTEFLAISLKHGDLRYGMQLMLCWPELWEGFGISGWEKLLRAMGPRPDVMRWGLSDGLNSGEFADVVFLLKWLRLDALYLANKSTQLSHEEKRQIAAYCAHGSSSASILEKNTLSGLWKNGNDLLDRVATSRLRLGKEDPGLLSRYSGAEELRGQAIAMYNSYQSG